MSQVWLREQILHGGGPVWLEPEEALLVPEVRPGPVVLQGGLAPQEGGAALREGVAAPQEGGAALQEGAGVQGEVREEQEGGVGAQPQQPEVEGGREEPAAPEILDPAQEQELQGQCSAQLTYPLNTQPHIMGQSGR